jgi:hypothetical protein
MSADYCQERHAYAGVALSRLTCWVRGAVRRVLLYPMVRSDSHARGYPVHWLFFHETVSFP